MNLDCNVVIGGVDYTSHVIGIERRATLCEQDHVVTVTLDCNGSSIVPYDEITIKELGTTVFTGYVEDITVYVPEYNAAVTCRTARKKLEDYWLDEEHVPDGASTVADEIAWAMTQAGVSYETESNVGSMPVPSDRTWRYVSTWDMIEDLLRTGGLQIWDAADGVLHIGRVYNALNPSFSLDDFLSINRDESDDYTRNGIAVYGSGVMSFDTRTIDWLGTRKRYGAFAIPEVRSVATAQDLVSIALDEFGSKADVITCEVEGNPSYRVSQVATLTEEFCNINGEYPLTSLESTMRPDSGYKMRATFGERCPVLWGRDTSEYDDSGGSTVWPGQTQPYSSNPSYQELKPHCVAAPNGICYASWHVWDDTDSTRIFRMYMDGDALSCTQVYEFPNCYYSMQSNGICRSPSGKLWCAAATAPGLVARTSIAYSTDGVNWSAGTILPTDGGNVVRGLAACGDDTVIVFKSTAIAGGTLYAARSYDGAATWYTPVNCGSGGIDSESLATSPSHWYYLEHLSEPDPDDDYVLRIRNHDAGGSLYASTVIIDQSDDPFARADGDLSIDPLNSSRLWAVYRKVPDSGDTQLRVWFTADGGMSTAFDVLVASGGDYYTPKISGHGSNVVLTYREGAGNLYLRRSTDSGQSWGAPVLIADDMKYDSYDLSIHGVLWWAIWLTSVGAYNRVAARRTG